MTPFLGFCWDSGRVPRASDLLVHKAILCLTSLLSRKLGVFRCKFTGAVARFPTDIRWKMNRERDGCSFLPWNFLFMQMSERISTCSSVGDDFASFAGERGWLLRQRKERPLGVLKKIRESRADAMSRHAEWFHGGKLIKTSLPSALWNNNPLSAVTFQTVIRSCPPLPAIHLPSQLASVIFH